ncbi:ABC-2 transporter permease [Corynebacterium spheniscorum]|uniref:ABC-2 family transporter protein n=1 Tax=Corynebacterium spheniscorum TaxID=185761 RepID=A0A1I2TDA5_9CORY|nr:ABC-2 transporter permease [Corynebacterium spheniscorum]KAA8719893.1 ABC-2 transporter permease [Corynebacterium spheniscorum]SFG62872.1 ABC-2 family transporter protein [Corynebacterium spheniscorum]
MKAVLYKDFTVNRNYLLILAVITLVLSGLSIYMREPVIFLFLFAMIGLLYFTAVFARDAESNVNRTLLAGPITKTLLVNANYLALVILGVVAFVVSGIVVTVMTSMPWQDAVFFASGSFTITLLLSIIQLPLFYKFGPDKARLFYIAVFILVFAGSQFLGDHKDSLYEWVAQILTLPALANAGILLGSTLVLAVISLVASRAIMAQKEF